MRKEWKLKSVFYALSKLLSEPNINISKGSTF